MLKPFKHTGQRVFQGSRFDVVQTNVLSKAGEWHPKEVIEHPGAVIILPFVDNNHIVLIRQERFAIGEVLWELPAGTLEQFEEPQITALRELREETGYFTHQIDFLFDFYPSPGISNEIMHAFAAHNLTKGEQSLDATEHIETSVISWDHALHMIRDGLIRDSKTITTLLLYNLKKPV